MLCVWPLQRCWLDGCPRCLHTGVFFFFFTAELDLLSPQSQTKAVKQTKKKKDTADFLDFIKKVVDLTCMPRFFGSKLQNQGVLTSKDWWLSHDRSLWEGNKQTWKKMGQQAENNKISAFWSSNTAPWCVFTCPQKSRYLIDKPCFFPPSVNQCWVSSKRERCSLVPLSAGSGGQTKSPLPGDSAHRNRHSQSEQTRTRRGNLGWGSRRM